MLERSMIGDEQIMLEGRIAKKIREIESKQRALEAKEAKQKPMQAQRKGKRRSTRKDALMGASLAELVQQRAEIRANAGDSTKRTKASTALGGAA